MVGVEETTYVCDDPRCSECEINKIEPTEVSNSQAHEMVRSTSTDW